MQAVQGGGPEALQRQVAALASALCASRDDKAGVDRQLAAAEARVEELREAARADGRERRALVSENQRLRNQLARVVGGQEQQVSR